MNFVQNYLKEKGAASVEIVTFVEKKTRRNIEGLVPKYFCFEYDQEAFLVGYGFDLAEQYRNLPAVYMHEYDEQN